MDRENWPDNRQAHNTLDATVGRLEVRARFRWIC